MPWPLSQDYNEALQNPQTSFCDPELSQGQVVVDARGIPLPCSGNFADVYAVECLATRSKWAVKCFTREVQGLRERYSEISSHLRRVRLPFTVDFQYLEQGVRIAGHWYPVLKMHWVEGFTLNTFVRNKLDKPAKLEKLSRIWVRMARRLREADVAHCDLQHGNILLVPDTEASSLAVKLIDYDGMWVPALANMLPFEFGHPAYQHPKRLREGTYNAEVDRFPLLAIYVALRALAVGGRELWERYDTGDNLLFRQSDFESPANSPLFAELMRMDHPAVRNLAEKLMLAANNPLDQTLHLADLVVEATPSRSTIHRSRSSTASLRGTDARETNPPTAQENDARASPDVELEVAARDNIGSYLPWIVTGAVAALTVVSGVLLLTPHRGGTSEKSTTQAALAKKNVPVTKENETREPDEIPPPAVVKKDDSSAVPNDPKKAPNKTTKPNSSPTAASKPKLENPPAKPSNVPMGKLPVPDAMVLRSITEEIQDVYKADYTSKEPARLTSLAEKLLQRGQKTFETPERRFVFLREASDVAAKAGEAALSLGALDELDKLFTIDLLRMKTAALQQAAKTARTPSAFKVIIDTALSLVVTALQSDNYDAAEHAVKAATETAYRAGFLPTEIQLQAREISRIKKQFQAVKPALDTLVSQPADAQANRLAGSFLCFQKGDWKKGLPLLARGDDAKLQELASKDLAAPASADAQTALGNGWWQLGMREKEQAKANILQRACYWYERALPEVTAPVRARLVKNIEAHYKVLPALRNWDHLDISEATVMLGYLHLPKGEKEIRTREAFSGPIEVIVIARTEKNNIRLRGAKGSCVIFNWERKPEELRITRPDGQEPERGSLASAAVTPLLPNTWYALRWIITEDSMAVAINGQIVFSENHKNDVSEKSPIRIHSVDSDIDVKVFTVRSLGKKIS